MASLRWTQSHTAIRQHTVVSPLNKLVLGEHFSLCLISIYFYQMFEHAVSTIVPHFDKFLQTSCHLKAFSEEELGDELCPSPKTPPPLRAFIVNGCSNSESFLKIYIYLVFSGGEAELFVEPLCLPNCLWSSIFFFSCHVALKDLMAA